MKFYHSCPLNLALLGALGLLLSSCGQKATDDDSAEVPKVEKLTLISWSEYFDPEVFEGFKAETGIEIDYVSFEDMDELEARLKSEPGSFDVVVTDSMSLERLRELRLIQELDRPRVPNFSNIDPEYLGKSCDPGNNYSAPYAWGTTLLAYRKDKISDPETSWDILKDPANKNRTMILSDRTGALGISSIMLGLPMNSGEPEHLAAAGELLEEMMRTVGMKIGTDTEVREGLDAGTVWAATCYRGDAAMIAAENENVGFFIPSEGAPRWMDSFAVPSDSKHPVAAMTFINFMLRADTAAANANYTWYASPNQAAEAEINAELLSDVSVNPPEEIREKCFPFEKPDAAREELMNKEWLEVLNRTRLVKLEGDGVQTSIADGTAPDLNEAE